MHLSITVTGPPRPDGSVLRSGVDFQFNTFDEPAASRLVTAVRRCHHEVESTAGSEAQSSGDSKADQSRPRANNNPRLATEKQVRAIHAMADRQGIDLNAQLHDRFSVSNVKALTIRQASELIDELKNSFQSV